ncbi:MAG: hypothetical protein V1681_03260 [Candidatus Neomarinimicrobiota bacterium]
MNFLLILLLSLPAFSYLVFLCVPDNKLVKYKLPSTLILVIANLVGVGLFIILLLINDAEYSRTIAITWLQIAENSFTVSVTLNNYSALLLALWAIGSLIFTVLISTERFDPRTFRESLANLSIAGFVMNGLILANDFLLMLFFWALLDFCTHRIYLKSERTSPDRRLADGLTIGGILLLILTAFILYSLANTFQIDLIVNGITSGKIRAGQLLIPGIFIALIGAIRIYQSSLKCGSSQDASDEFIVNAGLIPSGLILLVKLYPILTSFCLNILAIGGGIGAILLTLALLTQNDFRQFIRLNTLIQISLLLIVLGIGALPVAAFLLIAIFITNYLLICLIRLDPSILKVAPGTADNDSGQNTLSGGFIVRLATLFIVTGLPLTMVFNAKILIFNTVLANPDYSEVSRIIVTGLIGLVLLLNVAAIFRIFLMTGALKLSHPPKTVTHSLISRLIVAGLIVVSLYPIYTLPQYNPLTIDLNLRDLFINNPMSGEVTTQAATDFTPMVVYLAIILIGILTGFLFKKYLKGAKLEYMLAAVKSGLRKHSLIPVIQCSNVAARRMAWFDKTLIPDLGARLVKFAEFTVRFINRLNAGGAREMIRIQEGPNRLAEQLFQKIQRMKFYNLILISLIILTIIVLICII